MKKPLIFHPFLFAAYPVLFLFAHNIAMVSASQILLPILIILGITSILFVLLKSIVKNSNKAGIIISVFWVLFFTYGQLYAELRERFFFALGQHHFGHRYLVPIYLVLFASLVYFVVKAHKKLNSYTRILNVVSFSLIIISVFNIGSYSLQTRGFWRGESERMEREHGETQAIDSQAGYRDIYYIILDGYASSAMLRENLGYDNHEFIDYLNRKGFYIASLSRCNYSMSYLSLASSLNMEYVDYIGDIVGLESRDRMLHYRKIKNNNAMKFLKSKGYKFIHFGSGWGATKQNRYADFDIQCGKIDEFSMILIQMSMLRVFEKYLIVDDSRRRILYTLERLAEIHSVRGPKFIFAHIMCPHPPYVFGPNGGPAMAQELKMYGKVYNQKELYLNQLIFLNKKVKILVDQILLKSETPPIIILQADHGTYTTFINEELHDNPTVEMLKERMRIFSAYYLPAGGDKMLYSTITPVNTFPLIFNFYFGANYKTPEDKSYYSTYEYPYKTIDVTDILSE